MIANITTPANNIAQTTKAIVSFLFISICSVLLVGMIRFFGCCRFVVVVAVGVVSVVVSDGEDFCAVVSVETIVVVAVVCEYVNWSKYFKREHQEI